MKEDEVLEFSFRSIRKKKKVRHSQPGCPHCGENLVTHDGKKYICGYSSGPDGVTLCANIAELKEEFNDSFIAELKSQFGKKK